jgi:hypothetical protein
LSNVEEKAVLNFASSFIDTNKIKQDLHDVLFDHINRDAAIKRVLNNPGLAFEYFLVDYMQREKKLNQHSSAKENQIKIFHKKAAAEQD